MNKPIKRSRELQPLSRDHHQGLLLCWKIRQGINKNVSVNRILKYINWFYGEHLASHFREEEDHLFPILGNGHPLIERALGEHRAIENFIKQHDGNSDSLLSFAGLLESHIRFEERVLFHEIEINAKEGELEKLKLHDRETSFCENESDKFWL